MSCNACTKKYGFFTKEVGCPNCGFSFCTKCLKKSIQVPKYSNAELKVCLSCFEKLSIQNAKAQQSASATTAVPSLSVEKSIVIPKDMSVLDAPIPNDEHVPDVDDEIKKRLEVIKQPLNNLEMPSDQNMAERLANLKGMPLKEYDHRKLINTVDQRTEQEKTNDLVIQFMNEAVLDKAVQDDDPIKSIERRLAALKGSPIHASTSTEKKDLIDNSNELEDEHALIGKIVNKYMDEATLPDSDLTPEEKEFVNNVKPTKDTEELPWCTLCNEDAAIRCLGCDGDLYCRACFKEFHAHDEEYREHQTKAFIPKENPSQ